MNGAARKQIDGRSAAAKLPPGPAREKAIRVAAAKISAILAKSDETATPAERKRRFEALKTISDNATARNKAATKLADIFLQHDLDNGLSLEEIKRNTRMIEKWAPPKLSARDIHSTHATRRSTAASPAKSRISA